MSTTPHHSDHKVTLHHGDCVEVLRTLPDCSVDSIVTDPPYELGFMGKAWDSSGVAYRVDLWREALRVLKPGGHLIAFGGTRTYHRLACAVEDAGFEVRDSIHWLYGSGFPKSLDIGKAIDKAAGATREVIGTGKSGAADTHTRAMASITATGLEVFGGEYDITAPATEDAKRWHGWGTALKPAHEPAVLARKPLAGTVAATVLEHGTGGLNLDACRVPTGDRFGGGSNGSSGFAGGYAPGDGWTPGSDLGRFPPNVLLDADAGAQLDAQAGDRGAAAPASGPTYSGPSKSGSMAGAFLGNGDRPPAFHGDKGGASRFYPSVGFDDLDAASFYYCAKASKRERNAGLDDLPRSVAQKWNEGGIKARREATAQPVANTHPTVKPLALMRWLVRLVTPPGGVVLEPFAGSGTTLVAAVLEGFDAVGVELTADYLPIITGRLAWAHEQAAQQPAEDPQPTLFDN